MEFRQIGALVTLCIVSVLLFIIYSRRLEYGLAAVSGRPFFFLVVILIAVILFLSILLATPISSNQIIDLYNIIFIITGCVQLIYGSYFYFRYPTQTAAKLNIQPNYFFSYQIGLSHISLAVSAIAAGIMHEGALLVTLQYIIWGWGGAFIHLMRAFSDPLPDQNDPEKQTPQPNPDETGELLLHVPEFYLDIVIPLLFLSFYIFGPGYEG